MTRYDPADKTYKMWYGCGCGVGVCYATSADGQSDTSVRAHPLLLRICSRALVDCAVPLRKGGEAIHQ